MINPPQILSFIKALFIKILPLIVYSGTFFLPMPHVLGKSLRQGLGIEILIVLVIFFLGFSIQKEKEWIPLSLIFLLFGTSLCTLWKNPISEGQVVGGTLYFSDASRYYSDALRMVNGMPFSTFSARHPFSTMLMTSFLWITGKNLRITLGITTALAVFSTWSAVKEVLIKWGKISAVIFCILLYLFYRRFIGVPDSENLGYIFGCLAFALLLKSSSNNNPWYFWIGFLTLTLGLFARPGPFFLLPAILFWRCYQIHFVGLKRFKPLMVGIFCISIVLFLNLISNKIAADKNSRLFSNFSYTFYGIVSGGQGWEQFIQEYPEYKITPEIEAERVVWGEAFKTIVLTPDRTISGIVNSYVDFFSVKDISVFGIIGQDVDEVLVSGYDLFPKNASIFLRLITSLFSLVGFFFTWKHRKVATNKFLLFAAVGVFFSIPFLPPIDAGLMRVYIASFPVILIFPIIGLFSLVEREYIQTLPSFEIQYTFPVFLSGFLALSIMSSLIIFILANDPKPVNFPVCRLPNSEKVVVELNQGNYLHLFENDVSARRISDVKYSDFQSSLIDFHKSEIGEQLTNIGPNKILMNTINLLNSQQLWIIIPLEADTFSNGTYMVCGHWVPEFLKNGLGFLEVYEVIPVSIW